MKHPIDADLLIFDADGTLRTCTVPGQPCPNTDDEWVLNQNVAEIFGYYDFCSDESPYKIAIASNQAGVTLGYLEYHQAFHMLYQTLTLSLSLPKNCLLEGMSSPMKRNGYSIWMCTSTDETHPMRKPNPGLLMQAMNHHNVLPDRTIMIGDMASDEEAAKRAGVRFIYAYDFFSLQKETDLRATWPFWLNQKDEFLGIEPIHYLMKKASALGPPCLFCKHWHPTLNLDEDHLPKDVVFCLNFQNFEADFSCFIGQEEEMEETS